MNSSVEMNNFSQYYGESLMEAWYRIKGISKNGKHTPAALIRNFYNGLNGWSKCFLDSLTNGNFASGNPSHANNLMENLFGNSIETKEETGIRQLQVSSFTEIHATESIHRPRLLRVLLPQSTGLGLYFVPGRDTSPTNNIRLQLSFGIRSWDAHHARI